MLVPIVLWVLNDQQVPAELLQLLNKHHQTHVLKYKDELKENELTDLLNQIKTIDFDHISQLYIQYKQTCTCTLGSQSND